jgi:thiol-disulfide isomerase/thioredoxin
MSLFVSSAVLDTDDTGLRRLTHEHLKVLAKFTADDCDVCAALAPAVEQFAAEPAFAGILFLRLDAAENPVAQQLMNQRSAPFFVSYCQGRILECDTLTTHAELQAQLQRLRTFQPQVS